MFLNATIRAIWSFHPSTLPLIGAEGMSYENVVISNNNSF